MIINNIDNTGVIFYQNCGICDRRMASLTLSRGDDSWLDLCDLARLTSMERIS